MRSRLKWIVAIFVVLFAVAQFVRPERANPATDPNRSIQAQAGTPAGLVPVLDRSCGDCHSNRTVWPWYTQVAPLSWVMAGAVSEGRKILNFSEWAAYAPAQQAALLAASCKDASSGKMPGSAWALLHPEAKLSTQDVETICGAAPSGQ